MEPIIRSYRDSDEDDVMRLSLRAWAPVYASILTTIGPELLERLEGADWRVRQRRDVEEALTDQGMQVWVADVDGRAVGFAAAKLDTERRIGEIHMLAVDPDHQRHGIGSELTGAATEWIRAAGLSVAVVETGGDDGHAPARDLYEKAGYTALPIVRYFKAL
jgi:ribosomal protein S18 acetylase RimI-like enzyme